MKSSFDAVLLIAFGGPTKREEIPPFLANVTRGLPIPPARIEEVARHYEEMGGRSPLNDLTFRQADRLRAMLEEAGLALPVYVGMRNWSPYLNETLEHMAKDGVKRAIGVILSAFQCEASWERYQRNVATAREQLGAGAPEVEYLGPWFEHPRFIAAAAGRVALALAEVPAEARSSTPIIFTAHSIPLAMADASPYVLQFTTASGLVARTLDHSRWSVAYQSRSGSPREPWLEPDIKEALRRAALEAVRHVVVSPIGFVSDHVEVLYDLDFEARLRAGQAGIGFHRAAAMNDHPEFMRMLAELVASRLAG